MGDRTSLSKRAVQTVDAGDGKALEPTGPEAAIPAGRNSERGCTCFQVRRAARLMTQLYDAELAPAGVSVVHYAVMNVVARDAELTISSLAERLATDRTTLSRTIDRMRGAGLIETAPGSDRRERRLRLTPQGERVFRDARERWQCAEDQLVGILGTDKLALLREVLGDFEDRAAALDKRPELTV